MVTVSDPATLIAAMSALSVSVVPAASVIELRTLLPPSFCEARSIALISALSALAVETLV
jgi:hypothetical protein